VQLLPWKPSSNQVAWSDNTFSKKTGAVQADVPAVAGAAQVPAEGVPPPNRLRGWSAATPEDLIEVRLGLALKL
jgi:hypothetical protein